VESYSLYLRKEAYDFLARLPRRRRELLFGLLDTLVANPFQNGGFEEHDESGRETQVLVAKNAAITYWSDHAVKEVKVIAIRDADR